MYRRRSTPGTAGPTTDGAGPRRRDEPRSTLEQLPVSLDAQLVRDAGISHYEYLVMAVLSMEPDRTLRMSEVAALTQSALSRLSNVATRLERRGWLTRAPDPTNGRSTLATLTDAGTDKVVASAPTRRTGCRGCWPRAPERRVQSASGAPALTRPLR